MSQLSNIFHLIDIIIFTQGLIFGIIFISTSRKEKPTFYLGLFLICFVFHCLPPVLELVHPDPVYDYELIPGIFMFLTLPLFYVYAHKVSVIKEQKWDYRILIPGIVELVILTILMLLQIPYPDFFVFNIYILLGYIFCIYIAFKIFQFCNKHLKAIKNQYTSLSGLKLLWVKHFIVVLLLDLAINLIFYDFEENYWVELFMVSIDLFMIYWIIYKGMQQENIEGLLEEDDASKSFQTNTKLKEVCIEEKQELHDIMTILKNYLLESKDYKQRDISIVDLASSIKISPKKVSKAINCITKENFNSYINSFRIEESVRYLQSTDFEHMSIEGIGSEAGFNSKSAFYNSFKKEKGCTPLELRKKSLKSSEC